MPATTKAPIPSSTKSPITVAIIFKTFILSQLNDLFLKGQNRAALQTLFYHFSALFNRPRNGKKYFILV
jgi:hypothetical protein